MINWDPEQKWKKNYDRGIIDRPEELFNTTELDTEKMISAVIQTKSTLTTSNDDISPWRQIKNDKNKMITIKSNRTAMPSLAVIVSTLMIIALYAVPCPTTAAAATASKVL